MMRAHLLLVLVAGCTEPVAQLARAPGSGTAPDAGSPTQDSGVPPDAGQPGPDAGPGEPCDDGDPCTQDQRVNVGCVHEPLADGSPCDDDDGCTHADICLAGLCRGAAGANGPPRLLSVSRPRFRGSGRAVGRGRYLFATRQGEEERPVLILTRAGPNGFDILDELQVAETPRDFISLATDLTVVLTQTAAQFLELSGDRLALRGRAETGAPPVSGAFNDDRLFLCVALDQLSSELIEFDAADRDVPRSLGSNPDAAGCVSVTAASLDNGAYATIVPSNLVRLVPQPGQHSTVEVLPPTADAVHSHDGFLTLATGASGVHLLREVDLTEVAAVQAAWVRSARHTSRGLEVYLQETDTLELFVYQVDAGSSPALTLLSRETVAAGTGIRGIASGWGSHNEGIRIAEKNMVFLLDDEPPFLREIVDPDSSWPSGMYVRGSEILLRDAQRAIRIDANDPTAPTTIAGGLHGGTPDGVALEFDGTQPVGLFGDVFRRSVLGVVDDIDFFHVGLLPEARVVIRRIGPDQRSTDDAEHDLDFSEVVGRRDRLGLVDRSLYRLQRQRTGATDARLDRWAANDFIGVDLPVPISSRIIASPSGRNLGVFGRLHDDTALAFSTQVDGGESEIYWLPLTDGGDPIGPVQVPWDVVELATHGDRMVAVGVRHSQNVDEGVFLLSLERSGNALREVSSHSWVPSRTIVGGRRILHFDGELVYFNFLDGRPGRIGNALIGLRYDALDGPLADYALPNMSIVDSFEVAPWGLVLAADDTLVIAEPWCDGTTDLGTR